MEQLEVFKERMGVVQKVQCGFIICLNLALIVFLAIFALSNPDAPAFYAELNGQPGMFTDDLLPVQATVTNIDEVHSKFVTWFTWGFATMIVGILYCAFNWQLPQK